MKGGTLAVSVAVYFTKARNFKQKGQNVNICLSLAGDTHITGKSMQASKSHLPLPSFIPHEMSTTLSLHSQAH